MSHRILALVMVAALAAGCSGKKRPPRPAPQPIGNKPAESAAQEEAKLPASSPPQDFVYSGAGKRDPFRSYLAELARETNTFASKCHGLLGKFEVDQMRLTAVITGLETPVAMVEVPGGKGVVVKRGQCIGKNGGEVAAVRTGEVVVTEYRVRADGTREPVQTSLQLPKQQVQFSEE
jgi:type IV pilus assembly protein PilP